MAEDRYAVLLMAYGGPDSLEDVEPYLLDVRGGRKTPQELVDEIRHHYELIGGKSPLLEWTTAQASALSDRLENEPEEFGVYVGMRHWHPYIRDVVKEIVDDGYTTIVALPLAPHYSSMSIGAYYRKLAEALEEFEADVRVVEVDRWHAHPRFIDAIVERLQVALQKFSDAELRELKVLFSAHSLPVSIRDSGDPYESYLHETAEKAAAQTTARSLARDGKLDWSVCYQSAGARGVPWLGPQVEAYIPELAHQGVRSILVAPIGFVTDHVEVLYDIDIEAREAARKAGVHLERTESMNTSPTFIDMLATVIRERIGAVRGSAE